MPHPTVRESGALANSFLDGLRIENRGMRIHVREAQLPLDQPDSRRDQNSQPSLIVGNFHLVAPGNGSLSRLLVNLTQKTFASADEFLKSLGRMDPRVGYPWRILASESLRVASCPAAEWNHAPNAVRSGEPVTPSQIISPPVAVQSDTTPPAVSFWINALFETDMYRERTLSLGRSAPDQESVRKLLALLDRAGKLTTRALANAMNQSGLRQRGFLAVTRRLLNVDGYRVLTVDAESDTVELDRDLLQRQFNLFENPNASGRDSIDK